MATIALVSSAMRGCHEDKELIPVVKFVFSSFSGVNGWAGDEAICVHIAYR